MGVLNRPETSCLSSSIVQPSNELLGELFGQCRPILQRPDGNRLFGGVFRNCTNVLYPWCHIRLQFPNNCRNYGIGNKNSALNEISFYSRKCYGLFLSFYTGIQVDYQFPSTISQPSSSPLFCSFEIFRFFAISFFLFINHHFPPSFLNKIMNSGLNELEPSGRSTRIWTPKDFRLK